MADDGLIEAGATGEELPYWLAKEAMRHAEARIGSQASTLQAFEARATSLLGWLVAVLTAAAGAAALALNGGHVARAAAFCAVFVPAAISAAAASRIVWPKEWVVVGFDPDVVLSDCESELQQLRFMTAGYGAGINKNADFLRRAGVLIRRAWWGLIMTPPIAVAATAIAWAVWG